MELTKKEIDFLRTFFSFAPVNRAFIFGSYSRDEGDPDSDVDILVELDYTKHIGIGFVKMKQDLEEALHKKVDLVSAQGISPHILPFINKEKKLIYER
jgi:predicted nucleotidyltransferase